MDRETANDIIGDTVFYKKDGVTVNHSNKTIMRNRLMDGPAKKTSMEGLLYKKVLELMNQLEKQKSSTPEKVVYKYIKPPKNNSLIKKLNKCELAKEEYMKDHLESIKEEDKYSGGYHYPLEFEEGCPLFLIVPELTREEVCLQPTDKISIWLGMDYDDYKLDTTVCLISSSDEDESDEDEDSSSEEEEDNFLDVKETFYLNKKLKEDFNVYSKFWKFDYIGRQQYLDEQEQSNQCKEYALYDAETQTIYMSWIGGSDEWYKYFVEEDAWFITDKVTTYEKERINKKIDELNPIYEVIFKEVVRRSGFS